MSREGYIAVVNGPNLNMLGRRQPGIYGTATLDDIVASLRAGFPQLDIRHECRQGEGELVELIQRFGTDPACLTPPPTPTHRWPWPMPWPPWMCLS